MLKLFNDVVALYHCCPLTCSGTTWKKLQHCLILRNITALLQLTGTWYVLALVNSISSTRTGNNSNSNNSQVVRCFTQVMVIGAQLIMIKDVQHYAMSDSNNSHYWTVCVCVVYPDRLDRVVVMYAKDKSTTICITNEQQQTRARVCFILGKPPTKQNSYWPLTHTVSCAKWHKCSKFLLICATSHLWVTINRTNQFAIATICTQLKEATKEESLDFRRLFKLYLFTTTVTNKRSISRRFWSTCGVIVASISSMKVVWRRTRLLLTKREWKIINHN